MKKKGASILDWFYIVAILFMISICVFVAYKIIHTANDTNLFADVPEAQNAVNKSIQTIEAFDNIMLFIIIGLSMFVLVSSAVVEHHPAMFIVGVILLFIAVTVSAVVSNSFWAFTNNSQINEISLAYPKITFLMSKLPLYVAFMGIISSIVMYISYNK